MKGVEKDERLTPMLVCFGVLVRWTFHHRELEAILAPDKSRMEPDATAQGIGLKRCVMRDFM